MNWVECNQLNFSKTQAIVIGNGISDVSGIPRIAINGGISSCVRYIFSTGRHGRIRSDMVRHVAGF